MAQARDETIASVTVTHSVVKFVIGFFAGMCAAFIPRLGAFFTTGTGHVTVFPTDFIIVGAVFGALIGGIIVILEYGMPKTPRDTFIAALGVPALLAGALNTASNTNELTDVARQQSTLTQALVRQLDIPILLPAATSLQPLTPSSSDGTGWRDWIPGVGRAHAADTPARGGAAGFNPAIQVQQQQYVIVLDEAKSKEQALARAKELRAKVPQAQAVQAGQGYLVIQGGAPKSETAALLDAVRLKNETGLQPKLLPVK